jgi:hypothetical protein
MAKQQQHAPMRYAIVWKIGILLSAQKPKPNITFKTMYLDMELEIFRKTRESCQALLASG